MQKILLGVALTLMNFAAAGQAIIPFVGSNLSWYQVKGDNYSEPVMGVNAGALADISLSSMFLSLQSGLQYTHTGGMIVLANLSLPAPPNKILYRVDAIQLPVMLTLKIGDEDGYYFAGAGFYVTANIGGTRDVQTSEVDPFGNISPRHYQESVQFSGRFDFGLYTGAGYHFAKGLELYAFYQKILSETDARACQAGLAVRYTLKTGGNKAKHKARLK
jgi:hypothetical protein